MPATTSLGIAYPITATDSNDIGYHMQSMAEDVNELLVPVLTDTGWKTVAEVGGTFGGNWSNYATGGWTGIQLRRKSGYVTITGAIQRTGATGTTLFTLPVGWRPTTRVMGDIATEAQSTLAKVVINTDGTVSSDFPFGGSVYTLHLVFPL